MQNNKRKRKYLGTHFQNKLLFLVLAASLVPATIVAVSMYYLIFSTMAWQIVFPELIAYNLLPVLHKVNMVLCITVPIVFLIILLVALELSHRIAGPLYRLEKELDERISGTKHGPIHLRQNDELRPLADRLNKLLNK